MLFWEALFSCTTSQLMYTEQSTPFSTPWDGAPADCYFVPPTEGGGPQA